jgi:prevent-host-death family protein
LAKRYSAQEARQSFADILGMVYYGKEPVIVEKRGKMVAAVISPEEYKLLQQQKEQAFGVIDRIQQRNAGGEPEEVLAYVTQVIEEVRQRRETR